MKQTLIALAIVFTLFSCQKTDEADETSLTTTLVATNQTNKAIVGSITGDSFDLIKHKSYEITYTQYGSKASEATAYTKGNIPNSPISYYIYNLADTTSYSYTDSENHEFGTYNDNLLEPYLIREYKNINNSNFVKSTSLTITDETLTILEKDYSMLETFPEYYNK